MLRLELEVEPSGESVQLDLALGEESVGCRGGGLAWSDGPGRGEDSLGQQTGQVSSLQHGLEMMFSEFIDIINQVTDFSDTHVLVAGIVGVDEWRLWQGVVIVFIFVLLGLSTLLGNLGLGRCLASTWNVVTVQNSVIFPGQSGDNYHTGYARV